MFLANQAVCCSGNLCCGILCSLCMRHCNTKTSQHAKLGYIFLALIASLMCLLALIYGPYMSSELDFIGFFECDADDMKCIGISIVYRISFALGLLFLVSALLSLLSEPIFHTYDHGCWTLKFLLFTSILILSFWVPNSVFN